MCTHREKKQKKGIFKRQNPKTHIENKHYTRGEQNLSTIKKGTSSITYYLQKLYWKITTFKPSLYTLGLITVAISIFLLGGGVYDILTQSTTPIAVFTEMGGEGRFLFLYPYPSLNDQFIAESIFIMILYALGAGGFLITYQSTKYAYKPRQAYITLMAGIMFIILSYVLLEIIFFTRLH